MIDRVELNATGTVVSEPPAWPMEECFVDGTHVLTAAGEVVDVTTLRPGEELRSVRTGVDGELAFDTVFVKACWLLPARERDIIVASASFDSVSADVANGQKNKIVLPIEAARTHSLVAAPVGEAWRPMEASGLVPDKHEVLVATFGCDGLAEVCSQVVVSKIELRSCKVMQVELEDPCQALLLQFGPTRAGIFVVAFGSPPSPQMRGVWKRGFFEGSAVDADSEPTCFSDPTHKAAQSTDVYRTIRQPHDADCKAWCRYHFKDESKQGPLCTRCHSPEHYEGRDVAPRCLDHHGR